MIRARPDLFDRVQRKEIRLTQKHLFQTFKGIVYGSVFVLIEYYHSRFGMQIKSCVVFSLASHARYLHHHSVLGFLKLCGMFVSVHYDVVRSRVSIFPENVFGFAFIEVVVTMVRNVAYAVYVMDGDLIHADLDVHFGLGQTTFDQVVYHQSSRSLDVFGMRLS